MDRKVLLAGALAALAMPSGADVQALKRMEEARFSPMLGGYTKPGKGKGRRPHHPSKRFVAMDKRDARKARNRRRG